MKKIFSLVLILVLIAISPVLAIFCYKCGKELPEKSNFCPFCGKAVIGAFQQAPPDTKSNKVASSTLSVATAKSKEVSTTVSTGDYEIIDQIESLLSNSSCESADMQANQLLLQYNMRMLKVEPNYHNFTPYQKQLHDLYVFKLNALKTYIKAWKNSEHGLDTAKSLAEKDKSLFIISHVNEAIDSLLNNGTNIASVAKAKDMLLRVQRSTQNFVVTSHFLIVDNQRINRGEPIWIIDVLSSEAKVLHMGHGNSSQPICGWVSIYDLEKRSSWRSNPAFFYSTPTTPTTVIYETSPTPPITIIYKNRRHRHHHYYGREKCKDKYHRYQNISPKYW